MSKRKKRSPELVISPIKGHKLEDVVRTFMKVDRREVDGIMKKEGIIKGKKQK